MAKMDQQTLEKLARLACLRMDSVEMTEVAAQLDQALQFFERIEGIPTEGVEPLVTPTEIEPYWRPDEVIPRESTEELLANAPERQGSLFAVPPVVGG